MCRLQGTSDQISLAKAKQGKAKRITQTSAECRADGTALLTAVVVAQSIQGRQVYATARTQRYASLNAFCCAKAAKSIFPPAALCCCCLA